LLSTLLGVLLEALPSVEKSLGLFFGCSRTSQFTCVGVNWDEKLN